MESKCVVHSSNINPAAVKSAMHREQLRIIKSKILEVLRDKDKLIQIAKVLGFYIAIYVVFLYITSLFQITPESVQAQFSGLGVYLVPTFILVQLIASLTPLPDLPFIAAGIFFFQPWAAFMLIWTGMWLGTIINFLIARRLGYKYIHKHYPQTSDQIDKFAGKYWFETVIISMSFTFVTFDLTAYAAGISSISLRKYGFAAVFGLIPVALNALLVGLALTSRNIYQLAFFASISFALAIVLGVIARLIRIRREQQQLLLDAAKSDPGQDHTPQH